MICCWLFAIGSSSFFASWEVRRRRCQDGCFKDFTDFTVFHNIIGIILADRAALFCHREEICIFQLLWRFSGLVKIFYFI
ncbi:Uncharacterised protein [Mycobacteroides abscessus subsp. abscessus]|nr:Uncharacterised protein [Mycobacteroides abscessus subsp. abscessus]